MPSPLISQLQAHPSFRHLPDGPGADPLCLSGLAPGPAALFLALWRKRSGRRLCWVAESNRAAESLARQCRFFHRLLGIPGEVGVLPASEADPYRGLSTHPEIARQRVVGLWAVLEGRWDVLIAPQRSHIQRCPSPGSFRSAWIHLETGGTQAPETLMRALSQAGYLSRDPVGNVGEYAHRGGIVDLFSPHWERPVRVEFFGDSIESMRRYDPATQRSVEYISAATVLPMVEAPANSGEMEEWARAALLRWGSGRYSHALEERTALAEEGVAFEGMEFLLPLSRPLGNSIADFMPDAVLVCPEPELLEARREKLWHQMRESFQSRAAAHDLALPPEAFFFEEPPGTFAGSIRLRELHTGEEEGCIHFAAPPVPSFGARVPALVAHLQQGLARAERFVLAMETPGTAARLRDMLREYDLAAQPERGDGQAEAPLLVGVGFLERGFALPGLGVSFLGEHEVFGEERRQPRRGPRPEVPGPFVSDLRDLKEGDFVVHVDHGIGVFEGLRRVGAGDAAREFVLLRYRDDARLYVPVERLDLIQKYAAVGARPPLDRLGGGTWERTRTRVRRAVHDMAGELLKLYARREAVRGHAFSPDDALQREFEDSFEFEETADQAAAIADVKRDMESHRPMDRLICGDVGYGKTEVAMRAAFKAVLDRKQVAVLTPTTVLAFQHFHTFRGRFHAFPVVVEMISRFRSRKGQREILQRTEEGKVDILVGTHRVLSRDVKFLDLGLVIVDEEQRFGVAQKEWLKRLKSRVDVLTLSATPIPRTLHMSLLGLRDLSVIETAPQDRTAIQTSVVRFERDIIRSAVELELQREGQVFFVHNRVESIYSMAGLVQRLCPGARVAVAHGQMPEKALEEVMLRFVDHQSDVLVCTTLIENGLDIPRANTILINRADRYGLSQLYQLRGRVGRSDRRAYAYMLVPPGDVLSAVARRRLAAIREFSDLGAGFRVAALDLEIRGAGNLLGGEQHGHIGAVGLEMYTQMLRQAVQELRGEPGEEFRTAIDLQCSIRIPEHFIDDSSQRLRLYKRIAGARDMAELERIREEVGDRFGRFPSSVENLFHYGRLRLRAEQMRISSIERRGSEVAIRFAEEERVAPERAVALVGKLPGVSLSPGGVLRVRVAEGDLGELTCRLLSLIEAVAA